MYPHIRLVILIAFALFCLPISTAHGRDCASGEAPASYVFGTCSTVVAGGADICQASTEASGVWVDCRAHRNGTVGGAEVFGDSTVSTADYVVYGTAANGLDFCCAYDDGPSDDVVRFDIQLSDDADDADFTDFSNSGADAGFQLYVYGMDDTDTIEGPDDLGAANYIDGNDHADTLYANDDDSIMMGGGHGDELIGNDDANKLYGDDLFGYGSGNDTIECGGGNDIAHGGGGNDTISGEGGDDEIYGEAGQDTITGGPGDDDLYGGTSPDTIGGGNGSDLLVGGPGANVLCGGTGVVELRGGVNDDVLWASQYATSVTGTDAGGTNKCGHTTHGSFLTTGSCGYVLSSKPAACP